MDETAKEHMAWCKKRAMAYLDRSSPYYSPKDAVGSMISDLGKHEETRKLKDNPLISAFGLQTLMNGSHKSAKKFITGFADF